MNFKLNISAPPSSLLTEHEAETSIKAAEHALERIKGMDPPPHAPITIHVTSA